MLLLLYSILPTSSCLLIIVIWFDRCFLCELYIVACCCVYRKTTVWRRSSLKAKHWFHTAHCPVFYRCSLNTHSQLSRSMHGLCRSLTTTKHSAMSYRCLSTTPSVLNVLTTMPAHVSKRHDIVSSTTIFGCTVMRYEACHSMAQNN